MATLTYGKRKAMKKTSFAIPSKKNKDNPAGRGAYPIEDKAHARAALARVSANGTPAEKAKVRAAVSKKYPDMAMKNMPDKKRMAKMMPKRGGRMMG